MEQEGYNRQKVLDRYGLTLDDYDRMWAKQNGRCAICCDLPAGKLILRGTKMQHSLHVDHDHDSNKVRGLLCSQCNRALGQFRDDPKLLIAAIAYLELHGKKLVDADSDSVLN